MRVMPAGEALAALAESSATRPVALGRYDVVGRIGQGGMGTVYDAIDRERGTRVALKTLSQLDAAAAVRLKREFRAVADLAHPNLAAVYELAHEDGLWFFAMERIDGIGFTRWARGPSRADRSTRPLPMTQAAIDVDASTQDLTLRTPMTLPPRDESAGPPSVSAAELRRAMAQLARGLCALHDAGVWHGDVKPENVLVRDDGSVVVVDFGLAEPVGAAHARRGPTAGTPLYMAPEQLAGGEAGPASDWYAVGTMLYEVLTGRMPFDADSLLDLYFQKSHQTPAPPRDLVEDAPEDLADAALALLDPTPSRRPSGAEIVRIFSGEERARAGGPRQFFVGRKRELRVLELAYGLARSGRPSVVHVTGPSGIGKSAMLRSFTRGVEDVDGAIVLRGRCYQRESVPYNAFDGIMDELGDRLRRGGKVAMPAWSGELAQVFPALPAPPPDEEITAIELRRRAFAAARELFANLSQEAPVVLAIDDLHWADADSARLLEALVADATRTRLLVVASYRPAEAAENPALSDYFDRAVRLAGEQRLVELQVGPLPPADAELLVRATVRDAAQRRAIAEEAGGVPFFIEELARYAAAHAGALVSLDEAIAARVRELPDAQRALFEIVAVADSPAPQSLLFEAAGLAADALPTLLALRAASLVGWTGAGADDTVAIHHDRLRESVIAGLDDTTRIGHHLALGRAFTGKKVFEAVRHLAAAATRLDRDDRVAAARLACDAGRQARLAAAFPLAFACFERGIALLPPDSWQREYELALELHGGAAEAAYLAAEWTAMDARCADLLAHARSALDQMIAWEVRIDASVGRHEYGAAIDAGLTALALLGVELPRTPNEADIGAAFQRALAELTRITPAGLTALPDVADPEVAAAMRIQVRLAAAAFFGQPMLLPIIACNLVTTSVARGLATATPFALALFGVVLNSVGMQPVSHAWGQVALALIERWPDRRLEAATRHVVHGLVCNWMVPLATTLAPLREVWDIGRRTGDLEYAGYAAHAYTHNALYAGRPLGPLTDEAAELGAAMRALGQVNALHVHRPFEQLLRALTGRVPDPPFLDDAGFDEQAELDAAARAGSRSGQFILQLAIGLARFHLGAAADALRHLEAARGFVDAAPSTWHVPMLHEYAALAACAAGERPREEDLAALRKLAADSPQNFAHRVTLIEGELARLDGDTSTALACFARAAIEAGDFVGEVALARRLAARCDPSLADAARAAYAAWGVIGR